LLSGTSLALLSVVSVNRSINIHVYQNRVSKNVTSLIVNEFYKLAPILIIFCTLYAETTGFWMKNFQLHLSYVATVPKNTLTTKNERICICCLPLKFVSGSEKLNRLDHDGYQQRSIANVQNDCQLVITHARSRVSPLINGFVDHTLRNR